MIACVVVIQRGGRGENEKREGQLEGDGGRGMPADERKNHDSPELIKFMFNVLDPLL